MMGQELDDAKNRERGLSVLTWDTAPCRGQSKGLRGHRRSWLASAKRGSSRHVGSWKELAGSRQGWEKQDWWLSLQGHLQPQVMY